MAGERTFLVRILGDSDDAIASFKKLQKQGRMLQDEFSEKLFGGLRKGFDVFQKVAAVGVAAIGAFSAASFVAIQRASDLNETISKSNQIFGAASREVETFASGAATALGQTKQQAIDAAATFGIFGKSAGLSGTALSQFSTRFVTLASDLASFNNSSPEEAIQAIGAALRGESEPIRRFGVLLNDAALKAAAMEMGIYNGNGALTAQQKVLAATEVIFQQTADAQGDFARTSDGLANQQRILKAQFDNISATLGQILLPFFLKFVSFINNNILPAIQVFAEQLGEKGFKQASIIAIASLGELGLKAINTFEKVTMSVLQTSRELVNLVQNLGLVAATLSAVTGNVVAFAKSSAVVIALDVAEQRLIDTTAQLPGKFDALRKAVLATDTAFIKVSGSALVTTDRLSRLEASLIKGAAASTDVASISTKVGGAVKSAGDKLKEYRSQLDKTAQAERSLTSAQRNRSQAQRSLDDANQDLLDAQTAFNQAVAGYGKDSAQARDAERALLRAQRERERAGYRVEESVFAVADAEKELSDARKDPETTPQRIRELEIRLAEAKLSVADATDSEVEATTNLSSAQSKLNEIVNGATIGSAVYETLLRAVNTAKDRQEEATYRLEQAILAEADAVKKLREEYKELANAAEAAGKTFNIPNIPVPSPAASGMRIMPDTVDKPAVVVNVTAGIGGNAYQVGKEIIEVLDQYTSVAGPLDTLMRVV
jgi:uncharacterized protein YpiB (UPF0302 family)